MYEEPCVPWHLRLRAEKRQHNTLVKMQRKPVERIPEAEKTPYYD